MKRSSSESRKRNGGRRRFPATYDWQEVLEGDVCEAGLEFKMDMATGRNYARKVAGGLGDISK